MQQHARQNYIQSEVLTATPQKLQLLLVEAAIKNLHRTKTAWGQERFDVGLDYLSKAQDIVAEILSSLDREKQPQLAGQIAAIYVFIFRRMSEAGMTHNQEKLDDAIRVLNSERETWRLVCEKFGSAVEQKTEEHASGVLDSNAEEIRNKTVTTQASILSLSSQSAVLVDKPGMTSSTFNRPANSYASQIKPLNPNPPAEANKSGIKTSTYSKPSTAAGGISFDG